ncbi:MAG TPA: metallophosphoesterase family protein [Candidatus Binatia bacterium]|nr:metallophosphoesterase family protein [Candidatus Binatia bacterium]
MSRYVVGDIHGCSEELRRLLESLRLSSGDTLVFLGDYIDRGPDSSGVVSSLLELEKNYPDVSLIFLKGNHEDMLLSFLGLGGDHGDMFLMNGGGATLESYGLKHDRTAGQDALSAIPPEHLGFYRRLTTYHVMDSFLCVHAGINPQKPLAEQSEEEMLWIRNSFIYRSHPLPYTVLFGHTPQPTVFFDLPYKVGLDTGLVYGNMLTCLEVDEKVLYQIGRGRRSASRTSAQRKWSAAPAFL